MLALDFMRQALLAAVLVGIAAPLIGIFLVQRQMSLIGDGIGHVALAGVAAGFLTSTEPLLTALIAAVLAALALQLRARAYAAIAAEEEADSDGDGVPDVYGASPGPADPR